MYIVLMCKRHIFLLFIITRVLYLPVLYQLLILIIAVILVTVSYRKLNCSRLYPSAIHPVNETHPSMRICQGTSVLWFKNKDK